MGDKLSTMIVATDVQYDDKLDQALAAGVAFKHWPDPEPAHEWTVSVSGLADYVPGEFYKRELPCLLALLAKTPARPDLVVVDGHTWLQEGKPGLGWYLYDALGGAIPVIGVAKRHFYKGCALELSRHGKAPLFVSSVGIPISPLKQKTQSRS